MLYPKLSIGLPVYNGENYLAESVQSILDQDFEDFELIISDNASTDGTGEICQTFAAKDSRIRYIRQESNLGAAPNYNLVVELARGPYFKWQAHDDNLLPGFLSHCMTAMQLDADAVLAYPMTSVIDGSGHEIGLFDDGLDLPQNTPSARLEAYLKQNFMRRRGLCNPIFGIIRINKLRRTRLIQDFLASDLILLAHLALLGKFIRLPEKLFERRVHPGISTAAQASHADRRRWFNTSSKQGLPLFDNELSLRIKHIRNLFQAIDELVDDRKERDLCRRMLRKMLIRDPKWIYIDLKYSLGFRPSWSESARSISANNRPQPHSDGSA
ncbi:Glycosyltransferase involved in cell wall bisynthesis [Roseivivax lentus]|uniref:Glycosyltransferase involved in cell wall bisynthesis n=2 Tax=Roseivivax lentus TaxID=633194 RepID=A0A1N7P8R6_9RHOB|nr:Glycosyltransferase involved in cell wall bisynthesis [Roseivivax lentus]